MSQVSWNTCFVVPPFTFLFLALCVSYRLGGGGGIYIICHLRAVPHTTCKVHKSVNHKKSVSLWEGSVVFAAPAWHISLEGV